jgi:ubiquinone/menaquinone biosynthesis C-methylase UbiE
VFLSVAIFSRYGPGVIGTKMSDPIFSSPRLAALYDTLQGERHDLKLYVQLISNYAARRVLDIGCGTGVFACLLASRGFEVIGLDPAAASLAIARQRCEAARVRWIVGDIAHIPAIDADMATMTGNVAQVFLTDVDWSNALEAIKRGLRPKGHLAFEIRDPTKKAWRDWNRTLTDRHVEVPGGGAVRTWCDVTKVDGPFVSFRWTYEFQADGAVVISDSTLRFRSQTEIEQSLELAGYVVEDMLDAPDRPGLEFVFVARFEA